MRIPYTTFDKYATLSQKRHQLAAQDTAQLIASRNPIPDGRSCQQLLARLNAEAGPSLHRSDHKSWGGVK